MTDYIGFMKERTVKRLVRKGEIFMFAGPADAYRRFGNKVKIIQSSASRPGDPCYDTYRKYTDDPKYAAFNIKGN